MKTIDDYLEEFKLWKQLKTWKENSNTLLTEAHQEVFKKYIDEEDFIRQALTELVDSAPEFDEPITFKKDGEPFSLGRASGSMVQNVINREIKNFKAKVKGEEDSNE